MQQKTAKKYISTSLKKKKIHNSKRKIPYIFWCNVARTFQKNGNLKIITYFFFFVYQQSISY